MTQPARPDLARTPSRNDHVRPGLAPSGAVRPASRAVGILALHIGILALHIGTRAWPGQPGRPAELPLAGTARRHVRRLASSATWPLRPRGLVPGWAVASAGLSPVVVTAGWLVADAVQPAAYNPIRKTVSVMAGYAGTDRWIMTGALLLAVAERLSVSIETCWPFVVAVALRHTTRPRTDPGHPIIGAIRSRHYQQAGPGRQM